MWTNVRISCRLPRILLCLALLSASWSARSDELPEYRLKAAFLYNFAAFTEWPVALGSTLNLCLYGADPFGVEADGLSGKTVGTRVIVVLRKTSPESLKGCQIVFVSNAAIAQMPHLRDMLKGSPVLTVADTPGAAHDGAMLNMNVLQSRISFEANLGAARDAGLTLSSKLLRLATEVIQ